VSRLRFRVESLTFAVAGRLAFRLRLKSGRVRALRHGCTACTCTCTAQETTTRRTAPQTDLPLVLRAAGSVFHEGDTPELFIRPRAVL
jgi:hypothetical protein